MLHLFIELANPREVIEKLSSRAEFQNEMQLGLCLESIGQFNDKGMLNVFLSILVMIAYKDRSFRLSVFYLILHN